MSLSPKLSAEFISRHSKHVTISPEGITNAADMVINGFLQEEFSMKSWEKHEMHKQAKTFPFTIDWIFLVDTLNFSFWSEKGNDYRVTYKEKTYTGYFSLCAAINRAIEEGFDIASPDYYARVTLKNLQHIFRSDTKTEIPLLEQRLDILHETGKILLERFGSSFLNCVMQSKKSANALLKTITENFPSYRDVSLFKGQKVSFYKRAQILIGDIWACFEGKSYGEFEDIDSLTIFADYRVPQVLVYLGALNYSDELLQKLKNDELIENGHEYEVEIRGNTIWAVELICDHIRLKQAEKELKHVLFNSILIDNYLWEYRRKFAEKMKHIPFHKVRCIYY